MCDIDRRTAPTDSFKFRPRPDHRGTVITIGKLRTASGRQPPPGTGQQSPFHGKNSGDC